MKLFIPLFLFSLLLAFCSPKISPEQKVYEDRQKHIALLQEMRDLYPCDTSHTVMISDKTETFSTPDTSKIKSSSGKDSIIYIRKDSIIRRTVTVQNTVIDSAALHELRLSGMQKDYLLQNCQEGANKLAEENKKKDARITDLEFYKRWALIVIGVFVAMGIISGIIKIKSII